jgi:hypothetical protein
VLDNHHDPGVHPGVPADNSTYDYHDLARHHLDHRPSHDGADPSTNHYVHDRGAHDHNHDAPAHNYNYN